MKKTWFLLLVLIVLCGFSFYGTTVPSSAEDIIGPLPPKQKRTKSPDSMVDFASRLVMDQFYEEGLKQIEEYIETNPVNSQVLRVIGEIVLFSGAAVYYDRIYNIYKRFDDEIISANEPEAIRAFCMLLVEMGKTEEYISFLRNAVGISRGRLNEVADIAAMPEAEREPHQKDKLDMANKFSEALKGGVGESLRNFFNLMGMPYIGGESMQKALFEDWGKQYKSYMQQGAELEAEKLFPDAICAYRRAWIFANDRAESSVAIARCYLRTGDFDWAKKFALEAGDNEAAKVILKHAEEKTPFTGDDQFYTELHPAKIGFVADLLPTELHSMSVTDKYIVGMSGNMGVIALDRETFQPILRDSYYNIVPEGKVYTDVKRTRYMCAKVLIDGDYMGAGFIDQATQGAEGLLRIYKLPNPKPIADIPLNMTLRTYEGVYIRNGYVIAVQSKGARMWISLFKADNGELIWRRTNYDDIIAPPVIVGDSIILGLSNLGQGSVVSFALKDGKVNWDYRFENGRVAQQFRAFYGFSGEHYKDYSLPIIGASDSENIWVAKKTPEGIVIQAINVQTGAEGKTVKLKHSPSGGFKKAGKYIIYLNDNDFVTCADIDGNEYWSRRNQAMSFFFNIDEKVVCMNEIEGLRVIQIETGATILYAKEVSEAIHKDGIVYTAKRSFDITRDRSYILAYVEKVAKYAKEKFGPYDYFTSGSATGIPGISPGESLLRDYRESNPGLTEVNWFLLEMTKNQYYSNSKDYMNEYMHSFGADKDRMDKLFADFFADFSFEWYIRADSFTGAYDDKGFAYSDMGQKSVCLMKPDTTFDKKFSTKVPQLHTTILTPDALVFFAGSTSNEKGVIDCVSRTTGETIWTKNYLWIQSNRQGFYHKGRLFFFTKSSVVEGVYKVELYCLDPSNGELLWTFSPANRPASGNYMHHEVAYDDTSIYIGATDASVYKVNIADGKMIWRFQTELSKNIGQSDCNFNNVHVHNGRVYTSATDDKVYCLDAETGQQIWVSGIPEHIRDLPAVKDGTREDTYWVAWPSAVGGGVFLNVLQYGGRRSIIAFDIETGNFKWEFRYHTYLCNSLIIDEKRKCVFMPVYSSGLEKISLEDGTLLEHLPLQSDTGYRFGDDIFFSLSGYLIKLRFKN